MEAVDPNSDLYAQQQALYPLSQPPLLKDSERWDITFQKLKRAESATGAVQTDLRYDSQEMVVLLEIKMAGWRGKV